MAIPNTTFRAFVEKLGDIDPGLFVGNEGDLFYDPNTASLKISDGVTPGGIPVVGVSTIAGPINFSLIPAVDDLYDLGSPTNQWRDLYVTGQTIFMGNVPMQMTGTSPRMLSQPTGVAHTNHITIDGFPIPFMDEVADMVLSAASPVNLQVNTDPKVYADEDKPEVNPNGAGGWYYTNSGPPHKINWHIYTKGLNDRFDATLAQWQGAWMQFTPWSIGTEYPFIQIYTLPKVGGGNAGSWYRSRITYMATNEAHIPGQSKLLYWGDVPDAYLPLPRVEMLVDPSTTVGPQDPDEVPFAIVINTNSGAAAGAYDFSTEAVGYKVADVNLRSLLYALPHVQQTGEFGEVSVASSITAGTFFGDGSQLTGVAAGISSLNDVGDVDADAPNDGDVLIYDSNASTYAARSLGIVGVNTLAGTGYEFTGGFADRLSGPTGVSSVGTAITYTPAEAAAGIWKRFGFSTAQQLANDLEYWGETDPNFDQSLGLFGGLHLPPGYNKLFDFGFNDPAVSAGITTGVPGSLLYTAAEGSYDFTDGAPGDFAQIRFSFNVIPQQANTTIEVGLIWSTRDENDNVTFTFPLTTQPIFYGTGTVGRSFLNRVTISAYFASDEDVNARALPAVRADNPILIEPLTTLATISR